MSSAVLKLGIEHIRTRMGGQRQDSFVFDVDSMPVDVHGNQLGGKYNGHYHRKILLSFFATCGETGDVLAAELRAGTQSDTHGFKEFVLRIARAAREALSDRVIVRLDAGFNGEQTYVPLEEEGFYYLMRLSRNNRLRKMAQPYLERRTPETERYVELRYKADAWSCARRVILVIRPRPDELFDGYYFLITNLEEATYTGKELADLYSQRGKAELHQGEMKATCTFCFPSSPRPKSHYREVSIEREETEEVHPEDAVGMENAVRLQLYMLVYELLHIGRCTLHSAPELEGAQASGAELRGIHASSQAEPVETEAGCVAQTTDTKEETLAEAHLHIYTFRVRVLKVGATIARHARYIIFRIAPSAVQAWRRFWNHFQRLRWHAVPDF